MNKTLPTVAFILALFLSAIAGTLFSDTAHANPYSWETISPPAGMKAPTITVLSPENNTAFPVNNVLLNCLAKVGNSTSSFQRVYFLVKYKADWQNETMKTPIQDDDNDGLIKIYLTLTDIPDGNHRIILYATEIGQIVTETGAPTRKIVQEFYVNSSSSVNFTVDMTSPKISFLSVENKMCYTSNISLNFAVNEPVNQISYVLDGKENVTIASNITLTNLPYGEHNVTVYATDIAGNVGASEIITFSIAEPFPAAAVAVASGASVAVVGLGLLMYFRKRRYAEVAGKSR